MSLAFLVTAFVVVLTPGTGALLSVAAGLRNGPRHGLVTAFGCTLGIVPHLVAAVTGAAALLRAGGTAFEVVRFLGMAYLLWTAWSLWRDTGVLRPGNGRNRTSPTRTVVSAVLANLLNPKLTIFFFVFLPQFVPPRAEHPVARMTGLCLVFMAMTFVVFALYGVLAGLAGDRLLRRPSAVRRLQRVFSLSLVGVAGRLAATD